ncbi:MAG: hypothetical protein IT424_13705 [Pirellulales bacterium]|nr:hypothetical protein [Pirellulales bacterium]
MRIAPQAGAEPPEFLFPAYCDAATAALWLFDEPAELAGDAAPPVRAWYYTQTITDASVGSQDLHRLNGSQVVEGRFGRALQVRRDAVGPGMQLAANFASEPRVYGVFLPADHEFVPRSERERESAVNFFWYTVRPDRLLSAIAGDAWTVEFWLNLADAPPDEVCLIDAGQGRRIALRLDLEDSSLRVSLPVHGIEASLPLDELPTAKWTHIAIVKSSGVSQLAGFIDGRQVAKAECRAVRVDAPEMRPGLASTAYAQPDFRQVAGVGEVADLGAGVGELAKEAQGIRLRGWIKAPYTGDVRFETGKDSGLRLDVDERPLMYGWVGRAAMYRRSPRWATIRMVKDKLYPVLIEMQAAEGEPPLTEQTILWSWPGQPAQRIPTSAWLHTSENQQDAELDEGRGFEPTELMATRFNLVIGSDRHGEHAVDGSFDELRISSVARYSGDFEPTTHSMNYGAEPPPPARPSGPSPLHFKDEVVQLGSRKHLFFDDALVANREGLEFSVNPPAEPEAIEPGTPGGDHTFFECDGRVALFAPAGYEGREDYAHLWMSDDGVKFRLHDAQVDQQGKKVQPIATGVPAWGRMAIDENPACPPWAKFKFTAGVPHRGIYLLVSPDAIHWRRNETVMLQIGTGGESHWYWDDQRGEYRYLLKWDHGPGGRQSVEAASRGFYEPWPLSPQGDPEKDLATPYGYMATQFAPDEDLGEVYRCRATKYAWAPDAYFAFVWRFDRRTQARQVELAASRDGDHWTHFGRRWYMPAEFEFNGNDIHEVTSVDGLIRRGDEIWQYADYSTGRHDGRAPAWRVRLKQRLDGFVSLDAHDEPGRLTTRPLSFAGEQLLVNAAAEGGSIRVALLNADGSAVPGFGAADCEPITGAGTAQPVSWRGGAVSELVGRPIIVQFEMLNAKLFAMQFK